MSKTARASRADTEQSILEAAVRLLDKYGSAPITMDAVAKEAGVAKGTLFCHFPCKAALFEAANEHVVDMLGKRLRATADSGLRGEALLNAAVRVLVDHCVRKYDIFSNFTGGVAGKASQTRIKACIAGNMRAILSILKTCADDGILRLSQEAMYDSAALFGICRSVVVVHRVSGLPLSSEKVCGQIVKRYLRGTGAS